MKIKILGIGCPKCHETEKRVKEVVRELNANATIEHVTDIKKIMEYPVLTTPGLVIEEELVFSGRVPTKEEIKKFITEAQAGK